MNKQRKRYRCRRVPAQKPPVDNKSDSSKIALAKGECSQSLAALLGIPTNRLLNL